MSLTVSVQLIASPFNFRAQLFATATATGKGGKNFDKLWKRYQNAQKIDLQYRGVFYTPFYSPRALVASCLAVNIFFSPK